MRIHASGLGETFEAAIEDLGDELDTAAAHEREVQYQKTEKGMEPIPGSTRKPNPYRDECLQALKNLSPLVKPVKGYNVRLLVSGADDGENAHVRLEIDLVRS